MKKIKVIIVDDSVLIQKSLTSILNSAPHIIVAGIADNPNIARQLIKTLNPDVLLLDIEMPEMDGITFLEKLMRLNPLPVVMCSSFTPNSREVTLEALELGAIDIISKPISNLSVEEIITKVTNASQAKVRPLVKITKQEKPIPIVIEPKQSKLMQASIIAIGASTGGTEALSALFHILPVNLPPIVVTQHLPEGFSALFASRANKNTDLTVKVAENGEILKTGHVYIAPAGKHLEFEKKSNQLTVKLNESLPINGHIPSADVMMKSVASVMGDRAMGILLTGMGSDGAQGMLEIQKAGGVTIAQDEESSVVWGMPRAAIELGAAKHVLALDKIPSMMTNYISTLSQ
ncbi:MAG: chemotaxis response regulator protein-glutamate methylesterase [Proteobacteria bacterium]|nr:chemotaxis response regulator protein-glutamate methylesterase [Pseudomonadota bacterium]